MQSSYIGLCSLALKTPRGRPTGGVILLTKKDDGWHKQSAVCDFCNIFCVLKKSFKIHFFIYMNWDDRGQSSQKLVECKCWWLLVLFKYFNHILYFVLFIIYYLLFSIRLIKKKYNILYLNKKKSLYLKNIVPGTENISILAWRRNRCYDFFHFLI